MGASFTVRGSFKNTLRYLDRLMNQEAFAALETYGQQGVAALSAATPVDTGETASKWSYEIVNTFSQYRIIWSNSSSNQGVSIAVLLQLGHGTGTGGYVEGRDYINPALRPVFDAIADKVWKEVTSG